MCKNMMVAGIKPTLSKKLWEFIMEATPNMSSYDKDGIGYAAMAKEGIWGERWLRPGDAFKNRPKWAQIDNEIKEKFKGTLLGNKIFNQFGNVDLGSSTAVILHARMATCEKGLMNVHPFVRDKFALIHNGIIGNDDKLTKITSTCDSEVILNEYVQQNVADNPDKIKDVVDVLQGSFACGVLGETKDGLRYMDIFKNYSTNLVAIYVKELEAVVFCTNEVIVRDTIKSLKWHIGNVFEVKPWTMIRLNAETGELISSHEFPASSRSGYYTGNQWHEYSGH